MAWSFALTKVIYQLDFAPQFLTGETVKSIMGEKLPFVAYTQMWSTCMQVA